MEQQATPIPVQAPPARAIPQHPRSGRRFGHIKDRPDPRDRTMRLREPSAILADGRRLPVLLHQGRATTVIDLRHGCPPVYDQKSLGSCTAHALAFLYAYDEIRQKVAKNDRIAPSRLGIYYYERLAEGTVSTDSGAQIRDGIKVMNSVGVFSEKLWPYDVTKFRDAPPAKAVEQGKTHKTILYERVPQLAGQLKACLSSGLPFAFGFTAHESLMSDAVMKTGILPMPGPESEDPTIGGHAVACVGYDSATDHFLIRNSWGPHWALGGYFWFPSAYMLNPDLVSDIWTVRTIAV